MKNIDHRNFRQREHHSRVSTGLFFIVLGLALLVATNDLLNLGSIHRYITWETGMLFIGVLLLLNRHFTGGILLLAGGIWFLFDEIFIVTPEIIKTIYWPAVIVCIGFAYILSSVFRRKLK